MQDMIAGAPLLTEHLDPESREHFDALCAMLRDVGVPYVLNPRLVRGLDYYTRTVFEWINTDAQGAQNAVCSGGRYDGLIAQLGGEPTPGGRLRHGRGAGGGAARRRPDAPRRAAARTSMWS